MKFISICLLQCLLYLCTGGLLHMHLNALYIYTMIYVANKSEFEKKMLKKNNMVSIYILYIKSMVSSQESCVQCILTNTSRGTSRTMKTVIWAEFSLDPTKVVESGTPFLAWGGLCTVFTTHIVFFQTWCWTTEWMYKYYLPSYFKKELSLRE